LEKESGERIGKMNPIQSIAFVINQMKPGTRDLADTLLELARRRGVRTRLTDAYPLPKGHLAESDACCVIGGDGTLLGVVSEAVHNQVPVLGINLGKLGFLATFGAAEVLAQFDAILSSQYEIEERRLLECAISNGKRSLALNDVVIRSLSANLVSLDVFSNGEHVNEYNCDGLILSTPTGSTAYNLSAGGPLVHPNAPVIALTPICSHTLSNRSVIFDHGTRLEVHLHTGLRGAQVILDGVGREYIAPEFPLTVSVAEQRLLLIQCPEHSHFQLIRNKLSWGNGGNESP
jgi:NAD+ kinase